MQQPDETYADRLLSFTIPSRQARGRIVRLDSVLDDVLSAHRYPPAIARLLAEALVVGTLIGGLVKDDEGQMTMQAQTRDGIVKLLVVDYRAGAVRGYADFDRSRLDDIGINPDLHTLFGDGYLAVTFDMNDERGRYQGIVPLEGESLSHACETYFAQSEQVPTLIRVAVDIDGGVQSGAGLLVQHLPDGEVGRERLHARLDHPEWEHVAILAGSLRDDELLDRDLSMEAIAWRLFHEEEQVRTQVGSVLSRGCRCSAEHYATVLARFGETERAEMRDEDGIIQVDCAFCSRTFALDM
ncbi:Hsp33 family molecular chaperone HslO [Erythrobacter litoralis]|uniref:Chaperone protein n=1 Tax=Erythrobacter litoralis (strain HTCC2594) TaxID=314225 RepID=Q2N614_ERYLH|nr:Hsp33 family molecular chaperone HslO [Erythrobacter litoralis]ABC64877.1 chaperone protein [Erythrobacter litoralis HTCC2594]